MFKRPLSPPEQSHAAKTVEIYGWIIFAEGGLLLLFPISWRELCISARSLRKLPDFCV